MSSKRPSHGIMQKNHSVRGCVKSLRFKQRGDSMKSKSSVRSGFVLSLVCLLPFAFLFSQSAAATKKLEFDHSTVFVRDLQKSADFYEKVFGLQRISEPFKD